MMKESDVYMTHLRSKFLSLLLLLILGTLLVFNANAASFSAKDIPLSLDAGYSVYNGTWIAGSDENALVLIGNEKDNAMKVAVASKKDGEYQIVSLSDEIISYQDYCMGSVNLADKWDDGRPYFWYEYQQSIDIYFSVENDGKDEWKVCYGYITDYENDIDFSYYTTDAENEIRVYETISPQICWPTEIDMSLQHFDLNAVQAVCTEALQYLNSFKATHKYGEQDEKYRIIWEEKDM